VSCPNGALLQSRGFVSSCFCGHSARRGFDTPRALPPLFWRVLDRLDCRLTQARLWVVDVVCGPFPDRNTPDCSGSAHRRR
jgi:hypothetical protein